MSNTDTNQASELFELCKKVYELTGWGEPSLPCWIDNATKKHAQQGYPKVTKYVGIRGKWEYGKQYGLYIMFPLYTSDYLLEKLPATIENTDYNSGGIDRSKRIALQLRKWDRFVNGGMVYFAEYHEIYYTPLFRVEANTPLKALLKLAIALHDSGALK